MCLCYLNKTILGISTLTHPRTSQKDRKGQAEDCGQFLHKVIMTTQMRNGKSEIWEPPLDFPVCNPHRSGENPDTPQTYITTPACFPDPLWSHPMSTKKTSQHGV